MRFFPPFAFLTASRLFFFANVSLRLLLIVSIFSTGISPAFAQTPDPAATLLTQLSPEEKVGQLFLVTFYGAQADSSSQIYDLIANHHIGGVALTAANQNFTAPETTRAAYDLIASLQAIERASADSPATPIAPHRYIPLFVAISQEGGGYPNDQILSGLSPVPDQMALGAAWNTELARQVGELMGREMSTLGFNLYLGLSLDVLTLPNPSINADLSTRVFGSSPYWVAEMGSAYLTGLRTGANNRLAVIAKHFPGRGGADRPADQEIATVRRSLEELTATELYPFFAVTGNAKSPASTADGLLVSHLRYQGLQGSIRTSTRPLSFDSQALGQLLALPAITSWRAQNQGLLVSDDLGSAAVRRFYDPDLRNFSGRIVARDAFLAGSDLLYMGNLTSSDAPDNYTTILRTLEFFTQKYKEDPAFASRVDESVYRILTVKYRLYGSFQNPALQPDPAALSALGQENNLAFSLARNAATLLSPSLAELPSAPPSVLDYIVFLSDTRTVQQCSQCPQTSILGRTALQAAVQRLYGPSSGGLVVNSHLSSYTFEDLKLLLDGYSPTEDLANDLGRANWVVLSTLDMPENSESMSTLRRFLSEKQSILNNKNLILFSFNAPYYLDSTDISKLTAYYTLYSETEPFIDVAARLLFQEIAPAGALPVSVPAIGYDLATVTSPDPNQVIRLNLQIASQLQAISTPLSITPEPTPDQTFRVGDSVTVYTGQVKDHNQHPVPDGTIVRFSLSQHESGIFQQVEAATSQGIASVSFRLEKAGLLEIRASSDPAQVSDTIQLNVTDEGGQAIIITPTAMQATPSPSPTALPPTPASTPSPASGILSQHGYPTFLGWLMLTLVLLVSAWGIYFLGSQVVDARWALRWALLAFLGGLLAYNYLVLDFPGAQQAVEERGTVGFLQISLVGLGFGFAVAWLWSLVAEGGNQPKE